MLPVFGAIAECHSDATNVLGFIQTLIKCIAAKRMGGGGAAMGKEKAWSSALDPCQASRSIVNF